MGWCRPGFADKYVSRRQEIAASRGTHLDHVSTTSSDNAAVYDEDMREIGDCAGDVTLENCLRDTEHQWEGQAFGDFLVLVDTKDCPDSEHATSSEADSTVWIVQSAALAARQTLDPIIVPKAQYYAEQEECFDRVVEDIWTRDPEHPMFELLQEVSCAPDRGTCD